MPFIRTNLIKFQYYLFILDTIDIKLYKPEQTKVKNKIPKYTCTVKFDSKALELIRLPRILNLLEVVFQLPDKLKNNDNNPTVTYQLSKTIRNKILNYKEAVNSIYGDKDVSFCLNTEQCDCADCSFCDPHHKYIITGDLRIIKNNKLRKLLTKGPNYREPRTTNFSKALIDITTALYT